MGLLAGSHCKRLSVDEPETTQDFELQVRLTLMPLIPGSQLGVRTVCIDFDKGGRDGATTVQ